VRFIRSLSPLGSTLLHSHPAQVLVAIGMRQGHLIALAVVLAMTVLARLIPALMLGADVADINTYRRMASAVLNDEDIYEVRNLFPYTPLSLFIPSFALHVATVLDQPFHLIVKQIPILGDAGTAALIFLLARRRWGVLMSMAFGLAFAFNPVSILVTGFHGNIMPFTVFFTFWAYYLLETGDRNRTYVLSALALGIGIGLRGWPILVLPFFLRPGILSQRQRIIYAAVAAFPSVLTLVPYLLVNFEGISREFFGYTSNPDFGWMGVWRNLWFLETGNYFLPGEQTKEWLERSRSYFLVGYALLVAVAFVRPRLLDTAGWIASAMILFYTLFGGVSAQYFSWVVPFLIFSAYGLAFSLAVAPAMMAFYLMHHPGIIFGPYPSPIDYTRTEISRWNVGLLLAVWTAGAMWLVWLSIRTVNQAVEYFSAVRSRMLAG
jgi:hypothetical protein